MGGDSPPLPTAVRGRSRSKQRFFSGVLGNQKGGKNQRVRSPPTAPIRGGHVGGPPSSSQSQQTAVPKQPRGPPPQRLIAGLGGDSVWEHEGMPSVANPTRAKPSAASLCQLFGAAMMAYSQQLGQSFSHRPAVVGGAAVGSSSSIVGGSTAGNTPPAGVKGSQKGSSSSWDVEDELPDGSGYGDHYGADDVDWAE
jgi:hypothetical protein